MLYLAIDGGGTKTEGILTDEAGRILSHRLSGPSNPHDITMQAAVTVLTDLTRTMLADLPKENTPQGDILDISFYAGVAGVLSCQRDMTEALSASLLQLTSSEPLNSFRFPSIHLDSDISILFAAELPDTDGACVISGTGSVCFLRHNHTLTRIGGWGYLLDHGGDGYSIGRDALEAVLRAHDGRGTPTALTERCNTRLGAPVPDSLNDIYAGGKAFIASFAPDVFDAAKAGDSVARQILMSNAHALAELILTAYRQGEPHATPLPVIMGGGLCQKSPPWVPLVKECLPSDISIQMTIASKPPVMGALALARRHAPATSDS